jgi:ABC-2 type transport system ATP-binding protein
MSDSSTMIETRDLTKKYGELYAINKIDIKLDRGDVFGFIGPNGAGKTTTMRILATLLNPTWGEAYVGGYSIYSKPKEIRRIIGYMPDFFGVYDNMKVIEYLEFFAAAYRIKGPARRKICDEVLELVDLGYKREAFVTSLSRGMTQRLGLARVLLHDPQVLLLDEPASGLDPRARIEIRGLLKELRKMGKTIMVSSHILPELADICNKIGIIERGELLVNDEVTEVMRRVRQQVVLRIAVADNGDAAAKLIEQITYVEKVEHEKPPEKAPGTFSDGQLRVTLVPGEHDYSDLARILVQEGHKLTRLTEEEINLETAFMALTKGITS